MSESAFQVPEAYTGERLAAEDPRFAPDMARHLAAYHLVAPMVEGREVLEAGCGEGYGAGLLAARAKRVVAVDYDAAALELARRRHSAPNLEFRAVNLLDLARSAPGSFDAVTNFQVIEHLDDPAPFLRAAAAGYPTTVDTTIEVGHVKRTEITRATYERQPIASAALPTFVVVPVRSKHHLTDALIGQLLDQGDADAIFVMDNGADTDPYCHDHPAVHVIPAAGHNIHRMWNDGVAAATAGAPRCNIAILNNDLAIGPGFLAGLARELRLVDRCLAVSPNYDARPGTGFQPVSGICANRYDGTGGLAGFAFMIPGEMFAAGFPPFDETLAWWYGDNDFVLQVEAHGGVYGIARDVTCEHIDGGSQTARDVDLTARIAADRATFQAKWGRA